ncbi:Uma2 family endonuclease [Nostoc sp. FACHB-87]|uniref:Uma2 family endonuclease n=1 Tax=Nostocaceae TaxID=1162 RepID=UPI00168591F8|nr:MULTISPECIES: Uma2 family endonuclease [Nostocaceae]MBD2298286.1 Uma2 family endonuclease [Nostoc sp. FACHB-190]MBD2454248.1 Uma2 family endonuclease [Nostoc sp. FACHB-87]MBD2474161.1 Uma2 family endonuclease [Anabaena sp. FACHB-83]
MVTQLPSSTKKDIIYPETDGQPMAENTKQFELIVLIKKNLDLLFANEPNVFVAGDLFWYPVEGDNVTRRAPDVMVVFGRLKGDRGSYLQWQEGNIPPQVVFEILSPSNTAKEMIAKYKFYDRYGVEEYYIYDPETTELSGWLRSEHELAEIPQMINWISPRLGIRFELSDGELLIYRPDGQKFLTYLELAQQREQAQIAAEQERQRAERECQRAEQAETQLAALRALLRDRGINPDEV